MEIQDVILMYFWNGQVELMSQQSQLLLELKLLLRKPQLISRLRPYILAVLDAPYYDVTRGAKVY